MKGTTPQDGDDLHPTIWLGLPVGSVALLWLTPLLGFGRWKALMMDEAGFIEVATVCFLIPAIVLGVYMFIRRRRLPAGVGLLLLGGAVAALYFAGEELSWGQSWIGFKTPEAVARKNVQGEFNLHNLSGWSVLNNVPRQLMLWATAIGGIVLPLALARRLSRPEARRSFWYWAIPTWRIVPICLIACSVTLPEKIYRGIFRQHVQLDPTGYVNMAFIDPAGEFKECCFALVILLYMLSIFLRMRSQRAAMQYKATRPTGRRQVRPTE